MRDYTETLRNEILDAAKPNVAAFARKAGVNRKTVEDWMRGGSPSVSQLGKIAAAIGGVQPWELLKPKNGPAIDPARVRVLKRISETPDHLLPTIEALIEGLLKTLPETAATHKDGPVR